MSSETPTILILHGAWHTPAHFAPLIKLLHAQDYLVSCPPLPSSNYTTPQRASPGSAHSQINMYDDAAFIRPHLTQLVYEGKEVLVLAHSYGGTVASEVVTPDLTARARGKEGLKGGVVGLLYMCAYPLMTGQSLGDAPRPDLDETREWRVYNPKTGLMDTDDAGPIMYNDMTQAEQHHWISLTTHMSLLAFKSKLSRNAVEYTPTSYMHGRGDLATPLDQQEKMVKLLRDAGNDIRTSYYDSGHSPYLSMPEKVVEEIKASIEWSKAKPA